MLPRKYHYAALEIGRVGIGLSGGFGKFDYYHLFVVSALLIHEPCTKEVG